MISAACSAVPGILPFPSGMCRFTSTTWSPDEAHFIASCTNSCHVNLAFGKMSRIRIIRDECFLDCRACGEAVFILKHLPKNVSLEETKLILRQGSEKCDGMKSKNFTCFRQLQLILRS